MNDKKNFDYLSTPTANLKSLQIGESLDAPLSQRETINKAVTRIRYKTPCKRFTTRKINDYGFKITRIN
jgi:hypothetical protein